MALQALHELYWPGDGILNEVPVTAATYPAWQTSVSACSVALLALPAGSWLGLGVALALGASVLLLARLPKRWRQRVNGLIRRYVPDWLWLAWRLCALVRSPLWARAQQAVAAVAVTPGMREPEMWTAIGHRAAANAGTGENVFRHLLALEQLGPVTNRHRHEAAVALELAYLVRKER